MSGAWYDSSAGSECSVVGRCDFHDKRTCCQISAALATTSCDGCNNLCRSVHGLCRGVQQELRTIFDSSVVRDRFDCVSTKVFGFVQPDGHLGVFASVLAKRNERVRNNERDTPSGCARKNLSNDDLCMKKRRRTFTRKEW